MSFIRFSTFLALLCFGLQFDRTSTLGLLKGVNKSEPKIINGTEAQWEGTRHQVSVRLAMSDWFFGAGHICGGALITPTAVLTAGHCIWSDVTRRFRNASDYSVVMGNLNRYQRDKNTLVFGVSKITVHSNYNASTYESDVAVLHLNGSVPSTYTRAHTITLNEQRELNAGTLCQVSGWGRNEVGEYPQRLRAVDVAIVNRSQCSTNYGNFLRDGMLCAGYMEGGRDACVGDSGGPLVCDGKLVGVVSFGVGCAQPGYPGVYANVANYTQWIRNVTRSVEGLEGYADDGTGTAVFGNVTSAQDGASNVSTIDTVDVGLGANGNFSSAAGRSVIFKVTLTFGLFFMCG